MTNEQANINVPTGALVNTHTEYALHQLDVDVGSAKTV